jgi:hypothetical protein
MTVDGTYLSARLTDHTARVAVNSWPRVGGNPERAALEDLLPNHTRSGADGSVLHSGPLLDCRSVSRPAEDTGGASTLSLLTLDLAGPEPLSGVAVTGVAAGADTVYASADRVYLAATSGSHTTIHAFDASGRTTAYVGSGSVDGLLLNRWALSAHEGYLRVATTDGDDSAVTVLAERGPALTEVGSVDGLGRGESIQAVRYVGRLGLVVTFRRTDPLYTLDLSDPARPRRLGELKVPGYSAYLHPVGDGLLLGIGQDADPATGRATGAQASLFDLTDLASPRRVDSVDLDAHESLAESDSRAFAFDPVRRTALVPTSTGLVALAVDPAGGLRETGRFGRPVERALLTGSRVQAVELSRLTTLAAGSLAPTGSLRW